MISYSPFWKTLKEKNKTTYYLIKKHGMSSKTIQKLRNNAPVNMTTIDSLCQILNCRVEDIVEINLDTPCINTDENYNDAKHINLDHIDAETGAVFEIKKTKATFDDIDKKHEETLHAYVKAFLSKHEEKITEMLLRELKKEMTYSENKNAARTPEQLKDYARRMRKNPNITQENSDEETHAIP